MTWSDIALVVIAAFAYGSIVGWWAGSRWRRAHDAARYAQIEARRMHVRNLKAEQLAFAGSVLAASEAKAIEALRDNLHKLEQLKLQATNGATPPESASVIVDFSFAVSALQRAGYDVTPTLSPGATH